MDNERFDDVLRRLATTRTTRGMAIRGILGGGAAVLLGTALSGEADARNNHGKRRAKAGRKVSRKAVAFDSSTGTGFVGKGDVQLAFGWNNQALQSKASGVTFLYNSRDTYDVVCEWTTETGGPNSRTIYHDITVPKHTSVDATVAYDARVRSQITGFTLKGFGATVTEGTVPVLGDACPGNNPGTITEMTLTDSTGGLFVNYGGTSYPLPNTPVV